jgi:ABC-type glycerol-3-phosphate transport system substrate-binding protein
MKDHRFSFRTRVVLVNLLIITAIVFTSCAPPSATTEPAAPTKAEETITCQSNPVNLVFWYPGNPEDREIKYIQAQVDLFNNAHKCTQPSIFVDLKPISNDLTNLQTAIASQSGPDVILVWSYKMLFDFGNEGILYPIEKVGTVEGDFLPDAVRSAQLNVKEGSIFGLPFVRDSCSQSYEYLSILQQSKNREEAFIFIDFLTSNDQQEKTYEELNWYPTRLSAMEKKNLNCMDNDSIRLDPENYKAMTNQLQELSTTEEYQKLLEVLKPGIILQDEATGVIENGSLIGIAIPVWNPMSGDTMTPLTLQEARNRMSADPRGQGVMVSLLIITQNTFTADGQEEYYKGNYIVTCWEDKCGLFDENKNESPYLMLKEKSVEMASEVKLPRVTIVPGSKVQCTYFLIFTRCTRVG